MYLFSSLSSYYIGDKDWSFICSNPKDNGKVSCPDSIPLFSLDNRECNLSYDTYLETLYDSNGTNESTNCVNWNQYYSKCMPVSENPFNGGISFDHAGKAFVAIFQVGHATIDLLLDILL